MNNIMIDKSSDEYRKAQSLASRRYQSFVTVTQATDGSMIYLSRTPELEGCHASGETPTEAYENLVSARIDFIYFLLIDGLSIPEPKLLNDDFFWVE